VRAVLPKAEFTNIGRLPVLLPHYDGTHVFLRVSIARGQAPTQATNQHMCRSSATNVTK